MNHIEVQCEVPDEPPWCSRLVSYSLKVLDYLQKDKWDVSILLCGDTYIRDLNKQYRDKNEATDVLSFESGTFLEDEEDGPRFIAGDIVISLETLPINAQYFNVSEDEELRRLVVHGILHLNGMDHSNNNAEQPMLLLQEKIMAELSGERILS